MTPEEREQLVDDVANRVIENLKAAPPEELQKVLSPHIALSIRQDREVQGALDWHILDRLSGNRGAF